MPLLPGDNFPVADASHAWAGSPLSFNHTVQSFYLDTASKLWVMAVDESNANLYLDSFSLQSGSWIEDHAHPMEMVDFGHGVAFGIEYVSGAANVWSECNSSSASSSGRGRAIARYPFHANTTIHNADVTQLVPVSGATHWACTYMETLIGGVVVARYRDASGTPRYQACLATLAANNLWVNLAALGGQQEPALVDPASGVTDTLQGFTASGNWLYILGENPSTQDPNIWRVDLNGLLNTGGTNFAAVSPPKTGGSGEPEGIFIGTTTGASSGAAALVYGRRGAGSSVALRYLT